MELCVFLLLLSIRWVAARESFLDLTSLPSLRWLWQLSDSATIPLDWPEAMGPELMVLNYVWCSGLCVSDSYCLCTYYEWDFSCLSCSVQVHEPHARAHWLVPAG